MATEAPGCRAERDNPTAGRPWLPAAAFVLFVIGFWSAKGYISDIAVADRFEAVDVQFGLWSTLIGAIGGFALAGGLYFTVWLVGAIRLSTGVTVAALLVWVVLVGLAGGTVLVSLFFSGEEPLVAHELSQQTRPVTLFVGFCFAPGLVMFLVLRAVAKNDANWQEGGRCQVLLILRLRKELRRLVSTLGAFLTLLVIATGMRRRALIALDSSLPLPREGVLLYGLVWTAFLGLFYVSAASMMDARASHLVDRFAPMPDPNADAMSELLRRRADLATALGSGGPWHTFQATVVIAAPLLSALVGSAITE